MRWNTFKIKEVAEIKPPKKFAKVRVGEADLVSVVPMEFLGIATKFFSSRKEAALEAVYSKYVYFEDDDVVMAKITPCFENGKIGVAKDLKNGIGFGSSEFIPFRCSENLHPVFLYHFMDRKSFRMEGSRLMTGAVGHKRIPKDFYEEFRIPIPPLEEQERIVEVLDEAFAAIDKAKANIERNLTNARELFQSRLNDIFSNPFEDWEVKPLGEVCTFKSGGTPSKSKPQLWGDGIPWISSKDMKSDSILETQDSVTLEAVGQGTRAVKSGTLLIVVRSGILMRKIPIALTGVDATFNQDIKALIVNSELSSEFLFWFLKGSEPTLLKLVTRSATVHRLETSVLTSFQIPIPESQEREAIVKTASLLNRLKKKLETKYLTELDNLEELRQSILEQAFEGKLTEPVAA